MRPYYIVGECMHVKGRAANVALFLPDARSSSQEGGRVVSRSPPFGTRNEAALRRAPLMNALAISFVRAFWQPETSPLAFPLPPSVLVRFLERMKSRFLLCLAAETRSPFSVAMTPLATATTLRSADPKESIDLFSSFLLEAAEGRASID